MAAAPTKDEAEAYLQEVDVKAIMEAALEAAVRAKPKEPLQFFARYFGEMKAKAAASRCPI